MACSSLLGMYVVLWGIMNAVYLSAIIAYRDENGPFTSVGQVKQVYGIGAKLTEKIAKHSYVE